MKFGIDYFPDADPSRVSGRQYFDDVLELAEIADGLGYDSVKIVEHYFTSYGGYCPDPCLFLAAARQRARRLRLVTGAVLPVFNHPLKLAGQLTMLDAISGGRLDVGPSSATPTTSRSSSRSCGTRSARSTRASRSTSA